MEVEEFNSKHFQDNGKLWGDYTHAQFCQMPRANFVGVLSKYPIEAYPAPKEKFFHGILHVKICSIHYLIVHLTHKSVAGRDDEISELIEIIQKISEPLIVMGDMNIVSPLDAEFHTDEIRRAMFQNVALRLHFMSGHETIESIKDGTVEFLGKWSIDYRPMQRLLDIGLIDLCKESLDRYTVSAPTNIPDKGKAPLPPVRIDFIFANYQLSLLKPRARVLTSSDLDNISDHYPVECSWTQ
jgi:endonuclease/exonuclease/phosphatase family metal-dependent hydrolase